MLHRKLNRLDLNLLKVFLALHEEGTVTAAGVRLGLSQSSVSNALMRLRQALDDPLFVRDAHGMTPTPLSLELLGPVGDALGQIQAALERSERFVPESATREFALLASDIAASAILPRLMAVLARLAPNVHIQVHNLQRHQYRAALEAGGIDIALGSLPRFRSDLLRQRLAVDTLYYVARRGHPIGERPSPEMLLRADHLAMREGIVESRITKALGRNAAARRVALRIDNYMIAPQILAESDLVSVLPASLVANHPGLKLHEVPFPVEPIEFVQFWHRRSHDDEGCKWLRSVISALFHGPD